jgi:multisubunit Na+/H+ antiporter MnhF subunit
MARLTNTAPNRVLAVDTTVVNEEPLLALLNLETDDGAVELAINRTMAELLVDQLLTLLGYDEEE